MFTRALLVLSLLILTIAPSPVRAQTPDVCQPGIRHAVYLPFVAGGDTVPKADLLRRIDEAAYGASITDADIYDESEGSAPETPSGISLHAMTDGILVLVDFNIDRSHLHSRFRNFNAWARQFGSEVEDDSAMLIGVFSDNDFLWQPPEGGYSGWEIALSAVTNTEMESAKSAWQRIFVSTVYDPFDDYGKTDTSDIESLYWLEIETFEDADDWVLSPTVNRTSGQCVEGSQGLKWTISGAWQDKKDVVLDLSNDSRFTDDDYITIFAYVEDVDAIDFVQICFATDLSNYYYFSLAPSLSNGANYLKFKRSTAGEHGVPDWSDITMLLVRHANNPLVGDAYITFDDWRIVKASPSDADTYSDTGDAWLSNDGTWHIYAGMRIGEPFFSHSLGQIESAGADDFFATRQNVEMPNNKASVGVLFRDGGRAGLTFRLADDTLGSEDALAVELDADGDTLYLVRYEAGSKSTLASVSYTPSMLAWLGVDFRDPDNEGRVKVYAAGTQWNLFTASALKISHATERPWPDGKQVGLVTHACNVSFVEYRAGSTATADYAHKAGHALTAGYSMEDYGAAVTRRVNLGATVGVWSMASVNRATGNVYDASGQGRTLTYNGNPVYNRLSNSTPYITLDGVGDYLSRADETALRVLGTESILDAGIRGLTLITWCWWDNTGAFEYLMSKDGGVGQYAYWLRKLAAETMQFQLSTDGTNVVTVGTGADTFDNAVWHFIAGVYYPSNEVRLMVDGNWYSNTTGIPASIFNSTADFVIAGRSSGAGLLTGQVGLCSLHFCNTADEVIERIYQSEKALYGLA